MILIQKEKLLKPLQAACSVVSGKGTIPILSNVLLRVLDGRLMITGFGVDAELTGAIPLDIDVGDCSFTAPAKKILDIVRSMPSESMINLSLDGDRLIIKAGRSRFTLQTLPAGDFPAFEIKKGGQKIAIEGNVLAEMITKVGMCQGTQDVRYYLNGVYLEAEAGALTAVATDGHRMAVITRPCIAFESLNAIVPRDSADKLSKLAGECGSEEVKLTLGESHVTLEAGGYRLISKLIDAKYPDYRRVLPSVGPNLLAFNGEEMKAVVSRALILSNEKYRGLVLRAHDGVLSVSAKNPEQDDAEIEIEIDQQGDTLEIGFNGDYLADVLSVLKQDVKMSIANNASSSLFTSDSEPDLQYVVMPMRV